MGLFVAGFIFPSETTKREAWGPDTEAPPQTNVQTVTNVAKESSMERSKQLTLNSKENEKKTGTGRKT